MLTARRRQASSKITARSLSVFAGPFCLFILPEPRRILRLTRSSCFSALATDNINCQPVRTCNGMHTVPLRIYALVSLKSCCNLSNCLAFCGLIACLLHRGTQELLKGGLKSCVFESLFEIEISWAVLRFGCTKSVPTVPHSHVLQEKAQRNKHTARNTNIKMTENAQTKHISDPPSAADCISLLGPNSAKCQQLDWTIYELTGHIISNNMLSVRC